MFVLTYGPVSILPGIRQTGYLAGYRNAEKVISVDFHNVDSVADVDMKNCDGKFTITLTGLMYSLKIQLKANASSFGTCLPGPMQNGFLSICSESFVATGHVTLWKRYMFCVVTD